MGERLRLPSTAWSRCGWAVGVCHPAVRLRSSEREGHERQGLRDGLSERQQRDSAGTARLFAIRATRPW